MLSYVATHFHICQVCGLFGFGRTAALAQDFTFLRLCCSANKTTSSLLHHTAMPPAQLGAMTLMEEWELVEDVPVDDRAGIMHNNAPSSIRGMLSQHGIPGHPQISAVPL